MRTECAKLHEQENCRFAKEGYLYLIGLLNIVEHNWQMFRDAFERVLGAQGKSPCKEWFVRLNSLRNLIAHPVRGDLTDEEREYLLDCDRKAASVTARIDEMRGREDMNRE
ncbi:MAG: hypothetical protein ABII12_13655 [Planctomycetota bacterium]